MAWPAQGAPRGCFSPCDAVSHPPGPMPTGCCLLPSQHSAAVGRWQTAAVVSGRSKGPCQGYPARRNAFEVKEEFCTSSRECFLRLWKRRVLWVLFYFPSYFLKAEVFLEAPAANRCLWQMAARLLLSLLITLLLFSNWTPLLWGSMWLPRCCSPSLQRSAGRCCIHPTPTLWGPGGGRAHGDGSGVLCLGSRCRSPLPAACQHISLYGCRAELCWEGAVRTNWAEQPKKEKRRKSSLWQINAAVALVMLRFVRGQTWGSPWGCTRPISLHDTAVHPICSMGSDAAHRVPSGCPQMQRLCALWCAFLSPRTPEAAALF